MDMGDKIYQVLVPTEEEIEIKNGKRHPVERKVFPGYVLVEMIMGDDSWYVVRNTPGVTSFVGSGNKPTPLTDGEVRAILRQIKLDAPKYKVAFTKGEAVRDEESACRRPHSQGGRHREGLGPAEQEQDGEADAREGPLDRRDQDERPQRQHDRVGHAHGRGHRAQHGRGDQRLAAS